MQDGYKILCKMATKSEETTMQGTSIGVRSRDLNDLIGRLKYG